MSDIFRRKQPGEAWETAVVSSGGGGSPGGVSGDVQYNNAGSFGGIQQSLFDVDPTTGAVTISPSDINASPLKAILDGVTVAEIYSNGDGTVGLQLNDVGVTPGTFTVDPASGIKFGSPTALFNVSGTGAVTISPSGEDDALTVHQTAEAGDAGAAGLKLQVDGQTWVGWDFLDGWFQTDGSGNNVFSVGPTGAVTISPSDVAPVTTILSGQGVTLDDGSTRFAQIGARVADGAFLELYGTDAAFPPIAVYEDYAGTIPLLLVNEKGAVTISPSDDEATSLTLRGEASLTGLTCIRIVDGQANIISDSDHAVVISDALSISDSGDGIWWEPDGAGSGRASLYVNGQYAVSARATAGAMRVGFFDTTPVAKPTGVAVTAGGIHAALVTLGLIAA